MKILTLNELDIISGGIPSLEIDEELLSTKGFRVIGSDVNAFLYSNLGFDLTGGTSTGNKALGFSLLVMTAVIQTAIVIMIEPSSLQAP